MRLLYPAPSNSSPAAMELRELVMTSRNEASNKAAADCVRDVAGMLKSDRRTAAQKELEEIFQASTDLAWSLWVQKSGIRVLDIRGLEGVEKQTGDLRFRFESDHLEAHAQHNRDLSEDDRALNDRPVLLLVSPAIMFPGTYEGTEYHEPKVCKKAVVWMG